LSKYRTFRQIDEAAEGEDRYLILSQNFRSRPEVLDSVNFLFSNIMSTEFGELDYTKEHMLRPGGSFPEGSGYETELDVLDCSAPEKAEAGRTDKNLIEARFVAGRIRQLLSGELRASDGEGGLRPVRMGDIAILLRSPGPVLQHYVRALTEQGLSWQAESAEDFFAATEVSVALSLLQIVDNPRQDVPLISALRSPVYGFTADRLAELRTGCDGDFYSALVRAAECGGQDCKAFLDELRQLRLGAGEKSSHQLIWHIYDRTHLLGIFGAMPGGEERRGNLLTLYELARRFEDAGHRGLFGFLAHLTRLRDSGVRLASAGKAGQAGGVSVMSIHRSKGLEFPVVFLCGLARRFNREDMQKPILFHPKLGVGPKGLDSERMVEYTTLPRMAVAKQLEAEMMAEELRLLYVAMTRAREKLILTHTIAQGAGDLRLLREDVDIPVEPQALSSCSCMGQWLLLAAMNRPEAGALRQAAGLWQDTSGGGFGKAWDIRLLSCAGLDCAPSKPEERAEVPAEGEGDDMLASCLAWSYPYAALAEVPSKLTATQLKGRFVDQEAAQEAKRPGPPAETLFHRPRFAAEELGLTAAQKGTALHLALQTMNFEKTDTSRAISEEIDRLVSRTLISPLQREAVDPNRLLAFFTSDLGRAVKASAKLRREFKFSLLVPASDYYPCAPREERVLLQGVIDCWFETLDGLTVLDFKTDRVTEKTVRKRAMEYRPQLAAYSRALEEITGKPVIRRVLWFFALDSAVEL